MSRKRLIKIIASQMVLTVLLKLSLNLWYNLEAFYRSFDTKSKWSEARAKIWSGFLGKKTLWFILKKTPRNRILPWTRTAWSNFSPVAFDWHFFFQVSSCANIAMYIFIHPRTPLTDKHHLGSAWFVMNMENKIGPMVRSQIT